MCHYSRQWGQKEQNLQQAISLYSLFQARARKEGQHSSQTQPTAQMKLWDGFTSVRPNILQTPVGSLFTGGTGDIILCIIRVFSFCARPTYLFKAQGRNWETVHKGEKSQENCWLTLNKGRTGEEGGGERERWIKECSACQHCLLDSAFVIKSCCGTNLARLSVKST